jgi:hypothetical protein
MSTHRPFHDFEPEQLGRQCVGWLIAAIVVAALLLIYAAVSLQDDASDHRVQESGDVAMAKALEAQRQAIGLEMGQNVRAAYSQGWREAMAVVDDPARGEAFALACARVWQGRQP